MTAELEAACRPKMPLPREGLIDGVCRYDLLPETEGMHWQAWLPEEGPSEGEGRPSRCCKSCIAIVMIELTPVVVVVILSQSLL